MRREDDGNLVTFVNVSDNLRLVGCSAFIFAWACIPCKGVSAVLMVSAVFEHTAIRYFHRINSEGFESHTVGGSWQGTKVRSLRPKGRKRWCCFGGLGYSQPPPTS